MVVTMWPFLPLMEDQDHLPYGEQHGYMSGGEKHDDLLLTLLLLLLMLVLLIVVLLQLI